MNKPIIIKPVITEEAVRVQQKSGNRQYAFIVNEAANKIQIRRAIEDTYLVEVASIRTCIKPPVARRRYTKTGLLKGKTSAIKKAYVTLREPKDLDFYNQGGN
jgi:large subunit ribosomal protein L23